MLIVTIYKTQTNNLVVVYEYGCSRTFSSKVTANLWSLVQVSRGLVPVLVVDFSSEHLRSDLGS